MNNYSEQTLAQIVINDHKTAQVFEKYHLDFCCKGKRSLASACADKNIDMGEIVNELNNLSDGSKEEKSFESMTMAELIQHILDKHHFYVKQYGPTIIEHLERVVLKHGDRYPWMKEVAVKFKLLFDDLVTHMQREEIVLFPRIKKVESSSPLNYPAEFISGPIAVMESEHEDAGRYMQQIRELTNNYQWPETACTTHRLSILELKEFEENLHQHVHLENNILFPRAIRHN